MSRLLIFLLVVVAIVGGVHFYLWARLVRDLPLDRLDRMTEIVPLAEVPALAPRILKGDVRGRVVIDLGG